MPSDQPRDPQAEANRRLSPGRRARVNEPSPPAVTTGPWFADDPVVVPAASPSELVVSIAGGDLSWADVVAEEPALSEFAAENWLADLRHVPMPPAGFTQTRQALLALAFNVVAPARHAANGKIGLRWTRGGFGTPFFGDDRQLRVEGTNLVRQQGSDVQSIPITTVRAAAAFVGIEPGGPAGIDFHDPPPTPDFDVDLAVDEGAATYLGDWFGFGNHVLERLLTSAGRPADTRVQIWPEHFDPAIELGDADNDGRASFGASPGDDAIPMPYFYVGPWTPRTGPFWDAPFGGAALTIEQLQDVPDQAQAALDFFQTGLALLDPADQT